MDGEDEVVNKAPVEEIPRRSRRAMYPSTLVATKYFICRIEITSACFRLLIPFEQNPALR
jgi:hypothetical protein